jgi:tetratricopeptide (TPR) repeat protein
VRATIRQWAAIALAASLQLAGAATARDLPGPNQRWTELRTPNFTFFSHASERATRRIAADLEELRAALSRFTTLTLHSPVPTLIYVFRHDQDFTPYKMLYSGRPAAASGYFARREHANYIAINGDSRLDASAIVYHEYVHYFASVNLPGLPLWFEEGLSELYSSFRVAGDKVQLGFPDAVHLWLLNTSPLIPLDELLAVDHGSPLYNERDRKGMFYAQSWALVHHLLVGSDQRRPEAHRFVALVAAGESPAEAFRTAFSGGQDQLEDELRQYVERRIFRYLEIRAPIEVEPPMTTEQMRYPDVLYRLGDLLAQIEAPRPEATAHFQKAVSIDPEHGPSLAGLGLLAERRANWADAERLYRHAMVAAPDDPTVQHRSGAFLLERGQDLALARSALERATQLAPSFGQAWLDLARAHLAAGDFGHDALAAAEQAHRLLPWRQDVTRTLFRLYLANERRDDAIELMDRSPLGDELDRGRARAEIAHHDLIRARQMVAQGRLDEAEETLASARTAAFGAASEGHLVDRIDTVAGEIAQFRTTARYNEAVVAFNRGDLDGARRILLELQPDVPPGRQAEAIRSLLSSIENPDRIEAARATMSFLAGLDRDDMDRFNELVARRDLDGARAHLEELRQRASPEEQEWIADRIAEIDAVFAHNRFVELYNRAVDQFNDGAYDAAITTLERLLAEHPDHPDADDARELLEETRSQSALR